MSNANTIFDPFAGSELESVVCTTKSQSEIWTACYFGGNDAARAYNESLTMEFIGSLDSIAMDRAIQKLVERHEALRAVFSTDGIYMSIFKQLTIKLTNLDLSNLDEIAKSEALNQYLKQETLFLFDLVQGPLIKFGLLKLSDTEHRLVITAHHIICDGWSIGIMLQDLGAIYSAYVENKIPKLTESIPFSSYANEEKLLSNSEENKEIEKYWFEMYKESIPVLNLPTDNPRPSIRTYKSQRLDFVLDSNLVTSIKKIGLSVGASFVTTLLTTFEIFLYQLTGEDDLVVGLPSAGQANTGMNHLIGHCVNLLPLRGKPNPDIIFIDYLKQRKSELFDAYDHSQLSFGHLLQKLNVSRDPSRIPLVPIVFNIDMGMTDGVHFSNLTYKLISNPKAYDAFEIAFNASGTEKSLVFEWSYNEALFKPETIKKMMISFEQIAQKIVENSSKTLGQITFQDYTSEYNNEINSTKTNYPNSTLHELFAQRVEMLPNLIAIEFNDEKITYGELEKKTNQMANYLFSQGLRPGQIVAVSLDKSPELIVTIYAILQCGAIYLPLDTEYPENRIQNVILDSEASFFISRFSIVIPPNVKFIDIEFVFTEINNQPSTPLKIKISPESIAYIIYTSGSTGKPKGVQISHSNVVNFVYSMKKTMSINEEDKFLSVTSISFDPMVFDVFVSLLLSASVVFIPRESILDGSLLLEKIIENKITVIASTPSLWQILIDSGWKNQLNLKAITGGEVLHKSLANSLLSKCSELWNLYGPTETTVASFLSKVSKDDDTISIGKPIDNTFAFLLDNNKKPVKFGEIGEIAIGGDGVSLGYLKQKDLTDKLFIKNTINNKDTSNKLYLTGDLAKLLPNGDLQYIGRIDQQVKIRGHRIEIGEIEHALMSIDNIKSAIVLAKTDILVAFIVVDFKLTNELDQIRLWRNELTSQLPTYMVPNVFHILEKIPTTQNDKIDRKALLEYKSNSENKIEYNAPQTADEKLVATIWEENLNIKNIDIFSNFFEIGGHSIRAVKVIVEIEKQTGKRIPLSSLFENSTIEKFAKLIESDSKIYSDCIVPIKPNGNKVPLFIIHGAGLNVLNFVNVIKHFDEDQPVYFIQGTSKSYDQWYESIEDMAAHYIDAIVKVNPNGPYALAGFSFGGVVAFEMTRQLKEQGRIVSLTALLDSYVDSSYYYQNYQQKKLMRYYDVNRRRLDFLKEMLLSWKAFKHRINAKKEYILKQHFGQNNTMSEQEALALEQFIEANKMVKTIVDKYHLKPQKFEVDLFRAKDDTQYKLDPTHLGWKKAALKGVKIHNIPGDHLDIVAPPNDKTLARMLQEILDEKHIKNLY